MKFKNYLFVAICMVICLGFMTVDAEADNGTPIMVHFISLPTHMSNGANAEAAYKMFQAEMVMLAGGFSELGGARGGSLHADGVSPRDNMYYIVSAKRDISAEIKKVIQQLFGLEKVFILVWPGHMVR